MVRGALADLPPPAEKACVRFHFNSWPRYPSRGLNSVWASSNRSSRSWLKPSTPSIEGKAMKATTNLHHKVNASHLARKAIVYLRQSLILLPNSRLRIIVNGRIPHTVSP